MSPRCCCSLMSVAAIAAASLVTPSSVLFCASAFILNPLPSAHHRTISIHHSSIDSINNDHSNNVSAAAQISRTLQDIEKDLLANPSKLQPILEQHDDDDREPTPNELAKETLLSTRLPNLPLNRTCTGPSTIEGAGRGLFAMEDIAKGELITCYPGDALLCDYSELEEEDFDEDDEEEEDFDDEEDIDFEDDDYCDEEADYIEEVVLWGEHVDATDRLEEDEVFDGIVDKDLPPLTSYAATVDDVYSVMGMPILDNNPAYYGHFANDGAGHIAIQTGVADAARRGIEEIISSYVSESVELSNARHKPIADGLHLGTFASKDIKKGEEVMVTYGPDYWMTFEG
mmetsp:Transcript_29585/g.59455  ORF Transcript_29585/g.59455 Transcript_29585/m.59455 type:complete len:343 (-) Transcript_29585:44-1072(-)